MGKLIDLLPTHCCFDPAKGLSSTEEEELSKREPIHFQELYNLIHGQTTLLPQ